MVSLVGKMSWQTGVCYARGIIEQNITAVAHGTRTKESVLQEAVNFFKADFISASQRKGMTLPPRRSQHVLCA